MSKTKIIESLILLCLGSANATHATSTSSNISQTRGASFILSMCSDKATRQGKLFNEIYKHADVENAGWLYGATANPDKCTWAGRFYSRKKPKRVRIHVCNSTCFPERGRKCEQKECFEGASSAKVASTWILNKDKKTYSRIDRIIEMIKSDYKAAPKDKDGKSTVIDFAVSSCLECTLTADARKVLNEYVKTKLKSINKERLEEGSNPIKWVDNPIGQSCFEGYICEKHGTPKMKNGIADNDGVNYDSIDQYSYWNNNTGAFMSLAWKPCMNGSTGKNGEPYVNPRKRTNWCTADREGLEFDIFTKRTLELPIEYKKEDYNKKDLEGCSKYNKIDFVWKLSDNHNYTTMVTPYKYKKFKKVNLQCGGKIVDKSGIAGRRFGSLYTHDPVGKQRRIYDFGKPLWKYPKKCVLHTDNTCYLMPYPMFRPLDK